jgi:hypothetical protein
MTPPVPGIWTLFITRILRLPQRHGARLWRALVTSAHPQAKALVWHAYRVEVTRDMQAIERMFLGDGVGQPCILLPVIETLVESGALDRRTANVFEDACLRRTGVNGRWVIAQ